MKILSDIFLSFSTLNISSHCLMFSIVCFLWKTINLLKVPLYVPNCFPLDVFKIFSCSLSFIYLFSDLVPLLIKSICSTVHSLWCCSSEAQFWACAQSPWHQFLLRDNSSFSLLLAISYSQFPVKFLTGLSPLVSFSAVGLFQLLSDHSIVLNNN